jgi:hypothetical protein
MAATYLHVSLALENAHQALGGRGDLRPKAVRAYIDGFPRCRRESFPDPAQPLYDRVAAIYCGALERQGSAPPTVTLEEAEEMRDLILDMVKLVKDAEREVRRRR